MSKLVPFPSRRRAKEQAATWIVRLDEGLAADERAELGRWLEADPAHAPALLAMARAWDSFDSLGELAEMFPLERYGHERRARWPYRVAAAVLAAAGAAALGAYGYLHDPLGADAAGRAAAAATSPGAAAPAAPDAAPDAVSRSYRTAVGEQLSVRLPDGSLITLNTDTLLGVEYSAEQRSISMERGEAIYHVARDPARPFRVRAGERVVEAVGTVFNVKLTDADDLEVTVTEGRVRVAHPAARGGGRPPAEQLILDAGNLARIDARGEQVRPMEPAQIEASLAWQRGMLVYRGETLAAVLSDMSRYTTTRFLIADDSLRERRVGGYFRAGDVDGLLLALHESFGVEQRREGDTIILTAGR